MLRLFSRRIKMQIIVIKKNFGTPNRIKNKSNRIFAE